MRLSVPVHRLKRRAKRMVRDEGIALHAALDRVAQTEGFARWSLLSARSESKDASSSMIPLPKLAAGDMLLIGGRPGHGKTRAGLRLLLDAVREKRRSVFFTLEYSERDARDRSRALERGGTAPEDVEIVASDEISADTIVRYLRGSPPGTLAVVDYLQILDQKRSKPPLSEQMRVLHSHAGSEGHILGFISQVDRSFDSKRDALPTLRDLRLPNPIDTRIFSKACFMHAGAIRFGDLT